MNKQKGVEENQHRKLNLGCGSVVISSWMNVDNSFGARLFKMPFFSMFNAKFKLFNLQWDKRIFIHNLEKAFPWNDDSVDVIYSSHTLEHFSRDKGLHFIKECYRVLRKGGIIRLVVPDLSYLINEYVEGRLRSDDFVQELGVLTNENSGFIKKLLSPFISFPHKCMYDEATLTSILADIGFAAQRRERFESEIIDIMEIELEGRTGKDSIIIEGIKE